MDYIESVSVDFTDKTLKEKVKSTYRMILIKIGDQREQ